ncbi:hypothetical protein GCM10010430_70730 [Kitasatospora cystarginea]|uniref:DUF317 domain-containing protein n=1 Tax=Kitasatospora cystarginea TaxID=58350 RepID=A0ABN3EXB1_9ACTN
MWDTLANRGWTQGNDTTTAASPCGRAVITHTTDTLDQQVWRIQARQQPAAAPMWTIDINLRTPAEIVSEITGHLADALAHDGDQALQSPGKPAPLLRALRRQGWVNEGQFATITEYRSPGEGLAGAVLWRHRLGRGESEADPQRLAFQLMAGQQPEPSETAYQGWYASFDGPVPHTLVVAVLEATLNPEPVARSADQIPSLHRDDVRLNPRTKAAKARTADRSTTPATPTTAPTVPLPAQTRRTR